MYIFTLHGALQEHKYCVNWGKPELCYTTYTIRDMAFDLTS